MSESPCEKCQSAPAERCRDCFRFFCATPQCFSQNVRPHRVCAECHQSITCHGKGICGPCDRPCHDITDYVSVGSCGASYDDFHIIFNLNYPENDQTYGKISRETRGYRTIWKIGIRDQATAEDLDLFRQSILLLRFLIQEHRETLPAPPRVLFHCFAGYSRSVALATAYLALTENLSVDAAFEKVKAGRKYVGPLPEFMALLRKEIRQPK